jgi:hypothetical protein
MSGHGFRLTVALLLGAWFSAPEASAQIEPQGDEPTIAVVNDTNADLAFYARDGKNWREVKVRAGDAIDCALDGKHSKLKLVSKKGDAVTEVTYSVHAGDRYRIHLDAKHASYTLVKVTL